MDGMNNPSSMNPGGQGAPVQSGVDPRLARMQQQAAQQFAQQSQQRPPVAPATPNGQQPVAPSSGSRTSNLRDQMRQNQRSAQGQPTQQVVLEQGETYNPQGQANVQQPVQQRQQAQTATNTVINTTNNGQVPDIDTGQNDGGGSKFKLSKGIVMAIVGMVIVAIVFLVITSGKGKDDSGDDNQQAGTGDEWVDPFDDPNIEWMTPDSSIFYNDAEKATLRAAGYTGDEIDSFAAQGLSAADLIAQAEAARDAWIQDAIAPLYDTASDEYKEYIAQTWLTLRERTDAPEWSGKIATHYPVNNVNLDYEKVPVHGNQLFIKLYLDDYDHDDWVFVNVTPEQWLALNDHGNVVASYWYVTHWVGDDLMTAFEDTDTIFIYDVQLHIN